MIINLIWAIVPVSFHFNKPKFWGFWVTNNSEILTFSNSAEHRWCKWSFCISAHLKDYSQESQGRFFSKKEPLLGMQLRCKSMGMLPLSCTIIIHLIMTSCFTFFLIFILICMGSFLVYLILKLCLFIFIALCIRLCNYAI